MERGHRGDVDGLRALAIVAVVAFHAHLPGFGGGFVGVDVFFVISGYLITRNLLAETADGGRVDLRAFWARRVRRLVPALALVLAVTLVVGVAVLSPLEWHALARDGAASALYVSNVVFGAAGTRYFGTSESIFQHTWSLGVEEQFYVVWPIVVLVVTVVVGRIRLRASRASLVTALAGITLVSFALNVLLAQRGSPWAFFSLPTRMWEFGAAGLLAAAGPVRAGGRRVVGEAEALLGILLVVGAVVRFDGRMAYPGWAAVVPVVGTLLVIRGGTDRRTVVGRGLAVPACQAVGRASYAWYLWHWPVILLAVAARRSDTVAVRSIASLVSLGLAALSLRFLEDPVRRSPGLRASNGRTYALGAAATVVVLALAFGVSAYGARVTQRPFYRALADAQRWDVDAVGQPQGCRKLDVAGVGPSCRGGASSGPVVVVVGDSHAAQWFPALDQAGRRAGVQLVLRAYGNCPAVAVPVTNPTGPIRPSAGCRSYQRGTERALDVLRPQALVLADASYQGRILDASGDVPSTAEQLRIWQRAYRDALRSLDRRGVVTGVLLDNPSAPFDPIACIGRAGSARPCTFARADGLELVGPSNAVELDAARAAGAPTLSVTDAICGPERCRVRIGGRYVYRDANHLTDAFVVSRVPELTGFLRRVLADRTR